MPWRDNLQADLTPIQQSMTLDDYDYEGVMRLHSLMLGVVIDVFPCDRSDGNISARQTADKHGFQHEATVLVINDGASTYMVLENVVIPPFAPSGVDNYAEHLPRPSSCLTTGEAMSAGLNQIDPYDLDGDMCVIGFIGGRIDHPFIVSWWPHARNVYDTATSGAGHPDPRDGTSRALSQSKRYFRRINGVETVINARGDIVVSTTFAGSVIAPGTSSSRGRFIRQERELGGSIRLYMKPSTSMEWTWDPQLDGIGAGDNFDSNLPQPNPPVFSGGTASDASETGSSLAENTFLGANKESWWVTVPSTFEVVSRDEIFMLAETSVHLSSNTEILLDSQEAISFDSKQFIEVSAGESVTFIVPAPIEEEGDGDLPPLSQVIFTTGSISLGIPDPTSTEEEPKPDLSSIVLDDVTVTLESAKIKIGAGADTEPLVLGATLEDVLTNAVVQTAMGPANFDAATIARFVEFQSQKHVVE